jgi:hypothetical protein
MKEEIKFNEGKLDEALNVFQTAKSIEFDKRIAKLYDVIYNEYRRCENPLSPELEMRLPSIKIAIKEALVIEYARLLMARDRDALAYFIFISKSSNETDFLDKNKFPFMVDLLTEVKIIWSHVINAPKIKDEGGCFIATMAYGDYDHPQVMILRKFRDNTLDKSVLGRWFIKSYYHYSPKLVERLKNKKTLKSIIRKALNQFIKFIK